LTAFIGGHGSIIGQVDPAEEHALHSPATSRGRPLQALFWLSIRQKSKKSAK